MSNDQSLSKSAEKVEKIEVKPKPEDNEFNDASTSHIDIGEINDTIKPLETIVDFDNKGFELEDINTNPTNTDKNYFNRQERPGTMMSITSKSSRSSVNCTSGAVKCPNLRLKKFYSYNIENGGFAKSCEEARTIMLPEDGEFIGNWLLTEINNWDLHRERVILLTEKSLLVVTYNFISMKILDYRRLSLESLSEVLVGDLKYPASSFMQPYKYGGIKMTWSQRARIFSNLNPFGSKQPELVLTSHHILYNEKEKETSIYNCDEFIGSLEFAISKLEESREKNINFKEGPVEIYSYASIISVLYNQNWLGYNLDRNGISF